MVKLIKHNALKGWKTRNVLVTILCFIEWLVLFFSYWMSESDALTGKLKASVIPFLLLPQQDFSTCAVCCFLHDVNSLRSFSLITHSLSSFDTPLCSPSLSLLLWFLSPLLFFIRHQRTKLKQVSAPQLPWHAFPFTLTQKAELRDTKDLPLTPTKGSSGFRSTLITFESKIIFQYLFYCGQRRRQLLQFVHSLIAPLPHSLIFILLDKRKYGGIVWGVITV